MKVNEKKQIVQSSFYLQFKPKTRSKSCILGLNLVSDLIQLGEVRYIIASCNILAVNNNPFEDFPLKFLFFHENNHKVGVHMYVRGSKPSQIKLNNLFNEHFPS